MRTIHVVLLAACLAGQTSHAFGQSPSGDGPTVRDGSVGYIDSAIPQGQLRLRYDGAYRIDRPNRAEFFWARGGPLGPGVPRPETSIDYQELSAYGEALLTPHLSVFFEAPVRWLNPDVNDNTSGLADINAGFKFAFIETERSVVSGQLRVYIPTGEARRGLGTDHVSYEPALLFNHRLLDWLTVEGEARYWVAAGGTNFAGEVARYGLGFTFGQRDPECFWLTPVAEFVGWTVVSGQVQFPGAPMPPTPENARGDTIFNAKLGVRFGVGNRFDVYGGYGRALTGDVWYRDTVRLELRWLF